MIHILNSEWRPRPIGQLSRYITTYKPGTTNLIPGWELGPGLPEAKIAFRQAVALNRQLIAKPVVQQFATILDPPSFLKKINTLFCNK